VTDASSNRPVGSRCEHRADATTRHTLSPTRPRRTSTTRRLRRLHAPDFRKKTVRPAGRIILRSNRSLDCGGPSGRPAWRDLTCSFSRNPVPILAPLGPLIPLLPVRWAPVALLAWPTLGRFGAPALRSQLDEASSRAMPSVIRNRLSAVVEVDVSALLARVDVPVLYLVASEDRLVPRSASDELTAIPRIRFAEIEGPHFLLQARPLPAAAHVEAGDIYFQASNGSVALPVAGYDYSIDWDPVLTSRVAAYQLPDSMKAPISPNAILQSATLAAILPVALRHC
jgi:hypothetical protein